MACNPADNLSDLRGSAYNSRFIKANLEEVVRQILFVRLVRKRGTEFWYHAFRNTLIPLVTLLWLSQLALVGGSVIIEQILGWNGATFF